MCPGRRRLRRDECDMMVFQQVLRKIRGVAYQIPRALIPKHRSTPGKKNIAPSGSGLAPFPCRKAAGDVIASELELGAHRVDRPAAPQRGHCRLLCDGVGVVCDLSCTFPAARIISSGPPMYPMRQPVMAYAFETPLTVTTWSVSFEGADADVLPPVEYHFLVYLVADDREIRFLHHRRNLLHLAPGEHDPVGLHGVFRMRTRVFGRSRGADGEHPAGTRLLPQKGGSGDAVCQPDDRGVAHPVGAGMMTSSPG